MRNLGIKPSVRRRFEFIEFQLLWEGAVGRKVLQEKFEISPQQATNDLTGYLDIAPGNMMYDPRQRSYVARSKLEPVFSQGDAAEYLIHLEMLHQGYRTSQEVWPTIIPEFDAVAVASRKANPKILRTVLSAIRARSCLEIQYVSLSSEVEGVRVLCPHALASDGHRWHMRAYDLEKDRFSDFVLSRIETADASDQQCEKASEDASWHNRVKLKLEPASELSSRQKEQIEIEYGMQAGILELPVRKAMLFYYLRFYGFDPFEMDGECMRNKSSYRLKVSNLREVEECLARRK